MTTTLSLPTVPVGGFRPAFSNFTLCGYLHSVITIPSILIFPVQTMCPGYTQKNLLPPHTHKVYAPPVFTDTHREIEGERQMWTVTTTNSSPKFKLTLKIQLKANFQPVKLGRTDATTNNQEQIQVERSRGGCTTRCRRRFQTESSSVLLKFNCDNSVVWRLWCFPWLSAFIIYCSSLTTVHLRGLDIYFNTILQTYAMFFILFTVMYTEPWKLVNPRMQRTRLHSSWWTE